MKQAPKLTAVYTALLNLVGMDVTSDGFVRIDLGDNEYLPVTAKDGNVVVLPLADRLRDPNIDTFEVFHLLSDSIDASSSDLLTRYRHWLINRFNIVVGGIGGCLLGIAADENLRKKLRPDQQGFLELVIDADKRTVDDFSVIAEACSKPNQLKRAFMTMYIRNAAVLDKKSYSRVTAVNFPFFDDLTKLEEEIADAKKQSKAKKAVKPDSEIFGTKIRISDRTAYLGLMHYLIPNLDTPHAYDVGSNSRIAPGLDALMRAFLPLARHLNDVIDTFKGVDSRMDVALEEATFNLDWAEAFENLDVLWPQIRLIPQQSLALAEEVTPEPAAPAKPAATTAALPWKEGPAHRPGQYMPPAFPGVQPPTQTHRDSISVADMMNSQRGANRGQGYPGQQSMYPQQGGYPMQQQQMPPGYGAPQGGGYGGGYPPPNQGGYGGGRRSY